VICDGSSVLATVRMNSIISRHDACAAVRENRLPIFPLGGLLFVRNHSGAKAT